MKCKYLSLLLLPTLLISCGLSMEMDEEQFYQEKIKYNAEKKLGITIDPNHTWSSVIKGSVAITADAPLNDIAKVQILTESPFFNNDALFLAEAKISKGQTVTLDYEAPVNMDLLIAACVDNQGNYFIQPFEPGTSQVNFSSAVKSRTRAESRATESLNTSAIVVRDALPTLNAGRSIYATLAAETQDSYMLNFDKNHNFSIWANTNWAKELIWQSASNGTIGDSWTVSNGTVSRSISEGLDNEESTLLKAIFTGYLGRAKGSGSHSKQNNLETVRAGNTVKFFNNHLISDGTKAITIIPVQMASIDLKYCNLYYYYFNPGNIPSGMSEADYIKQLPKFKAIDCASAQSASGVSGEKFFKTQEFMLPYYGDSDLKTSGQCTPHGSGLFRIRNCETYTKNKKDYYLTYRGDPGNYNKDKMDVAYDDNNANIANQLWQIFTTSDNKKVLYNVGAKKFLIAADYYIASNNYWSTFFTDYLPAVKNSAFYFEERADGVTRIWYNSDHTRALGSNINKHNLRVATDKTPEANGRQVDWILEPYTNYNGEMLNELVLDGNPVGSATAVSPIIPQGYKIGFMMRKMSSGNTADINGRSYITSQSMLKTVNNGCVWGNGELNRTVNNYKGHFGDSKDYYGMRDNDPRIGVFTANSKTYLTFEDGNDCNFSDMIIEIGGYNTTTIDVDETTTPESLDNYSSLSLNPVLNSSEIRGRSSGILTINDLPKTQGITYTMCFEDRPNEADFDMNDVVLQARRIDDSKILLSLIACGAEDKVILQVPNSVYLHNSEIHQLFGLDEDQYYVNTQPGKVSNRVVFEQINIGKQSIEEFLRGVSIKNMETGTVINMQQNGMPPCAIIVPTDFNYPKERTSIVNAYKDFLSWAENRSINTDWYTRPESGLTFK